VKQAWPGRFMATHYQPRNRSACFPPLFLPALQAQSAVKSLKSRQGQRIATQIIGGGASTMSLGSNTPVIVPPG
jgi:hypothetical protein